MIDPWPGIELRPQQWKLWVLTTGLPKSSLGDFSFWKKLRAPPIWAGMARGGCLAKQSVSGLVKAAVGLPWSQWGLFTVGPVWAKYSPRGCWRIQNTAAWFCWETNGKDTEDFLWDALSLKVKWPKMWPPPYSHPISPVGKKSLVVGWCWEGSLCHLASWYLHQKQSEQSLCHPVPGQWGPADDEKFINWLQLWKTNFLFHCWTAWGHLQCTQSFLIQSTSSLPLQCAPVWLHLPALHLFAWELPLASGACCHPRSSRKVVLSSHCPLEASDHWLTLAPWPSGGKSEACVLHSFPEFSGGTKPQITHRSDLLTHTQYWASLPPLPPFLCLSLLLPEITPQINPPRPNLCLTLCSWGNLREDNPHSRCMMPP